MKKIYLDYAAGTPLDPRVERAVLKYQTLIGNPSSLHWAGRGAKQVIDEARAEIGRVLHCRPEELIFTGSGTEADNLAIFGVARAYKKFGKHLITTKIEHHAVLRACEYLAANEGFKVTYLTVQPNGMVDPETVRKAIRPNSILISIGYANNEIGTVQPIKAIAKLIRQVKTINHNLKTVFHTDASAAAGYLPLNVQDLGVDLLAINGAKIYGPKGIGCLFVRRGVELMPLIFGGDQGYGRRAGTESPALIAGLAKALVIAEKNRVKESIRQSKLRDWLVAEILRQIPNSRLNGDSKLRLPNNINISFQGVDGEMLMLTLDRAGIAVSTGSACTTAIRQLADGPSHVLRAIKNPPEWGNVRITLGKQNSQKDLEFFLNGLKSSLTALSAR